MITLIVTTFFLLLVSHAVCDFAEQNDYISGHKRRILADGTRNDHWVWVLGAHSLIHGGGVYLATGFNVWFALAETGAHFLIDFSKCEGKLTYNQDQSLHVLCKVLWLVLFIATLP